MAKQRDGFGVHDSPCISNNTREKCFHCGLSDKEEASWRSTSLVFSKPKRLHHVQWDDANARFPNGQATQRRALLIARLLASLMIRCGHSPRTCPPCCAHSYLGPKSQGKLLVAGQNRSQWSTKNRSHPRLANPFRLSYCWIRRPC